MQTLADTPGERFQRHLDTTRFGLFGHSLGGAALACPHEPFCPAALDIDGYLYGGEAPHDGLGKPSRSWVATNEKPRPQIPLRPAPSPTYPEVSSAPA